RIRVVFASRTRACQQVRRPLRLAVRSARVKDSLRDRRTREPGQRGEPMAEVADVAGAEAQSLEDIHSSVPIPRTWWRRFLAFTGPAFLVSIGYMDPGNWGTDIEAGSKFGYRLLWVLLLSNLIAVLLQRLATPLGAATGRDLAEA